MRTIEEIQRDYSKAAMEAGDLAFKRRIQEDELEKLEFASKKLLNNMESLANEARKLKEAADVKAEVALPEEAKSEQS